MTPTLQLFDRPDQQESWDEQVAAMANGHLLQSWAWGELKTRFGWRARRLALGPACAQVLFRPLPAGLGTIAYVPMGPAVDYTDVPALDALLQAVEPLARQKRAICLKIEPNLEDDPAAARQLRELGLHLSPQPIQPRRTLLVDLEAEPDEVLARMKQKTRYNVRLAERKGVSVRAGDENDLDTFYQLMETTGQRDGFGVHNQAYYQAAQQLFAPAGRSRLLLAEFEGQLLAGLVVFAFGDTAIYMYGASSDAHRNRMPTYLLQWEAMLWAKEQGCRVYDLWGVPDEDEAILEDEFTQRSDGLWGVYRFKRGFGGRLARRIGAWDLVYAPMRYRLYSLATGWFSQRQAG